jgi:hypothetical protein
MFIQIKHVNGNLYNIPLAQGVIYADSGDPIAIVYEKDGIIVYTDTTHKDFGSMCSSLGIKKSNV